MVAFQDRLSREDLLGTAEVWTEFGNAKARIVAADGLDTALPGQRMQYVIKAEIARQQWERYQQNWSDADRKAVERGIHICNVPPFGYDRGEDKVLVKNPATGVLVTELFERRAGGESWRTICEWLDEVCPRSSLPLPARKGTAKQKQKQQLSTHWTIQTLNSIVVNRVYLGVAYHGPFENKDAHPPLTDHKTFKAAQGEKVRHQKGGKGGALLATLVVCASCGGKMTARTDGKRGYRTYTCPGRSRRAAIQCSRPLTISMRTLDNYVQARFLGWLQSTYSTTYVVEYEPGNERAQALAALEAAEVELDDYLTSTAVSIVGSSVFERGLRKRQDALEDCRAALDKTEIASHFQPDEIQSTWPDLTIPERREILRTAIDVVLIHPAAVRGQGTPVNDRAIITFRR